MLTGKPRKLWTWVSSKKDSLPINAVQGGVDQFGGKMMVARAKHERVLVPGAFSVRTRSVHVPSIWDGVEYEKRDYEILVAPSESLEWTELDRHLDGLAPSNAIAGGVCKVFGEPLLVARFKVDEFWHLGFYQPSRKRSFAAGGFNGSVIMAASSGIQVLCEC